MRFFLKCCVLILCGHTALASPLNDGTPNFNITSANQTFDKINLQLSIQNLNTDNLTTAIDTLNNLTEQAEQCVSITQKKLTGINQLIQEGSVTAAKSAPGADLVYLANQQKKLENMQAQCRLFSIRAKDAIDAYKTTVAKLKGKETFTKDLPLWDILKQIATLPPTNLFNNLLSKIQLPPVLLSPITWLILSCIALTFSYVFMYRLKKTRFSRHYLHIKKIHLNHILLLAACFISTTIFGYLTLLFQNSASPILALELAQRLFLYFAAWLLILCVFNMKRVRILFYWYSLDHDFFRAISLFCLTIYTLSLIDPLFARSFDVNNLYWQLGESIGLFTVIGIEIYFVYYFCSTHRHLTFIKRHHQLIKQISILLISICAGINVLGYHTLAVSLTSSALFTSFIIFISILVIQGINKYYFMLSHQPQLKAKIIKYFGYRDDQTFTEFLIMKTTTQIIIIALAIFLVVHDWNFAVYYIEALYTNIFNGIHFANVTIYPTRIVLGILVYCWLYLLFRSISTAISRHQQFENEEETQVAIASIFTYIGFGFSIICALLIAGFNFTGLAIVAGALSVGIGLGLQSIVNNFVSGLILLIEKPIKPGDRINIDGVEGFVKKIRVRSTHIITPASEDVIVPNSDLITRRVTNYVYSNKQVFITCDINIPFGSDTQLVREMLLEAALRHDEIIKTGRNKPQVLFRAFGEKALIFQLYCLIKDVNKKLVVQSDLNFAIDKLLREKLG